MTDSSLPTAIVQVPGRCPLCEEPGAAASACDQTICVRKGHHRIPPADFDAIKQTRRPADPLIGTRIGAWLAVAQLGAGAFGVVYRVHDDKGRTHSAVAPR